VRAIGNALGVHPADLLTGDRPPPQQYADPTIVGAALASSPKGLADAALARALNWPESRVRDALATLAGQLTAVGQTLRRLNGHNQLAPGDTTLDPERLKALARSREPLDPDHARVLLKVLRRPRRDNGWETSRAPSENA